MPYLRGALGSCVVFFLGARKRICTRSGYGSSGRASPSAQGLVGWEDAPGCIGRGFVNASVKAEELLRQSRLKEDRMHGRVVVHVEGVWAGS